jgi:rhamnose transport system substrate-binding protein
MLNMKSIAKLGCMAAVASVLMTGVAFADAMMAKPGGAANIVLLPKFLGILPFDQANRGAEEAHKELGNTGTLQYIGPTPENSVAGQIEMLTTATTQKQNVVMLSNNAGDQIAAAAEAAQAAGTKVVTWDSPIPSAKGETVFVAQVDFGSIGVVLADMALSLSGGSGEFAVLSATPD